MKTDAGAATWRGSGSLGQQRFLQRCDAHDMSQNVVYDNETGHAHRSVAAIVVYRCAGLPGCNPASQMKGRWLYIDKMHYRLQG